MSNEGDVPLSTDFLNWEVQMPNPHDFGSHMQDMNGDGFSMRSMQQHSETEVGGARIGDDPWDMNFGI